MMRRLALILLIPFTLQAQVQVSSVNPRYLIDPAVDATKALYLTGSHVWNNFQGYGTTGTQADTIDWTEYLNFLTANKHSFQRLWAWEESRWTSDYAGDDAWFWPVTWYQRSGTGGAQDGLNRFDLTTVNTTWFSFLHSRMDSLQARGIYFTFMLFNGWSVQNRGGLNEPSKGHPFDDYPNNINSVDGDVNNDGDVDETHAILAATWPYQLAYVKRVIDSVNAWNHSKMVGYELCNEMPMDNTWLEALVDTVRNYESRTYSKNRLIWKTGDWTFANASLFNSDADMVSPAAGDNGTIWETSPPDSLGSKVVILDTDHLWGIGGDVAWVWMTFTRGNNPIWMEAYDGENQYAMGLPTWDSSTAGYVSLRKAMGVTRLLADQADLLNMAPSVISSTSDYEMAGTTPGYVIVYQATGDVTVDLTAYPEMSVRWIDPDDIQNGTYVAVAGNPVAGGASRTLTPPDARYDVLFLQQRYYKHTIRN